MKKFKTERDGQLAFFKNYGIDIVEGDVLIENTDGVFNGNIIEFKLNINNLNRVLFQTIKYLSHLRIKGESVPATILLVDLNDEKCYVYDSIDYIDDIEKVYIGGASKNNDSFVAGDYKECLDYSDILDSSKLKKLLLNKKQLDEMYIPINIDENCIVGWAERYYREKPTATKGDFIGDSEGKVNIVGEIREPRHFKGLINPYKEETNEKFKYLMDCLNDRLKKKDLGAFYTPKPYCDKAAELVLEAVNRAIDAGKKDYIILDRSAGTGNLESSLVGLFDKNGDELISHAVVSTIEYYEYKVLAERLGDKVRDIVPPTEADIVYENGLITNADAMSKEFIDNPIIKQYLDDPDCAIVIFENPPYRDTSASVKAKKGKAKESDVFQLMKKDLNKFSNSNVSTARDIANQFIWSAFEFYIKDEFDSYILFSPVKYWKTLGLVYKKMKKGYIFNRKYFHASASAISCIYWQNTDNNSEELSFEVHDCTDNTTIYLKDVKIKKGHNTLNSYYDKKERQNDIVTSVWCQYSGEEAVGRKVDGKSLYSKDILGYMRSDGFTIAPITSHLVRQITYNARGTYLRRNNYLKLLPIWATKLIPLDNWYEKDIYATTSDGGDTYTKDKDFLKYCLIYTCLSNQNKCLSFTGSDGRCYKNELCFDKDTIASKDLSNMELNEDEEKLISLWENILDKAKNTKNYNPNITYGIYQIIKELNTFEKVNNNGRMGKVYDYPELNGNLETLRVKLKEYYKKYITNKMFEYELIK